MNHDLRTPQGLNELADGATPLNDAMTGLDGAAASLARRGAEAVRDRTQRLQQQARHAGDVTVGYVRTDPVKSMLIAAAVGAGLMALLSLMTRGRHDR